MNLDRSLAHVMSEWPSWGTLFTLLNGKTLKLSPKMAILIPVEAGIYSVSVSLYKYVRQTRRCICVLYSIHHVCVMCAVCTV